MDLNGKWQLDAPDRDFRFAKNKNINIFIIFLGMSNAKSIYCDECRVRPKELFCDWCHAHICRCCSEGRHSCQESLHDINAIIHESKQGGLMMAELPPIEIVHNQLTDYIKKEEDNFYKTAHDKLQVQNEELNKKLHELETLYTNEIKNIQNSILSNAQNQVEEFQKKTNETILGYQAKIASLEAENAKLHAETLKKNVVKANQPKPEKKEWR